VPGLPTLHRALDALAMWTEDRVRRAPAPYRPGPAGPLACFGPVPALPSVPTTGAWSAPAPRGGAFQGDELRVHVAPAHGPRRGAAIVVPPWKLRSRRAVSAWTSVARRAGLDAWLLTPPHHLERAAAGARSGEGFVSNDLERTRLAFELVVTEIRALAAAARPLGPVGVLGLSLGALAAALSATGPEPLDFAALVAPPADLSAVLDETAIGRRYRALAAHAGAPLPDGLALREALAPLDPARRVPTAARVLVVAGAHDAIAPPAGAIALAREWGVEPHVYARGHLTLLFACRAARRDVETFLRG
jgi:hypothetical protein